MNPEDRDRLWMAYLDDEMTPSESSQFEQQPGTDKQVRVFRERQIESALGDCLTNQGGCPNDVWDRVRLRLANTAGGPRPKRSRFFAVRRLLPVAALLMVSVAGLFFWTQFPADFTALPGADYAQMHAASHTAPTTEAVDALLASAAMPFDVVLPDAGQTMHEVVLAGARTDVVAGTAVAEILLMCCGHPVKLLIVEEGTDGAAQLREAVAEGRLAGMRTIDGFVAAAAGDPMHSTSLLDVLQKHA